MLPRTRTRLTDGAPLRIAAFGSSTTEGHGASSPAVAYPAVLRECLLPDFPGGIVVRNLGIGGETAIEMDGRLADVLASKPDLILWQTGANDVTRPIPLASFDRLTRDGVSRLRATGADLVLIDQQYSVNLEACPALPAYIAALHAIAVEAGVPLFCRYQAMRDWCASGRFSIETLSPDGTHMEDAGYAALGHAVADWLRATI